MFTLIALGVGVAYDHPVVATLFPDLFAAAFRDHGGRVAVYFEAAVVITTAVIIGQDPGSWNCGPATEPGLPFGPCWDWRPRARGTAGPMAPNETCRWIRSSRAIGCGFGRTRRFRWTARCWKGKARWMNR